MGRFDGLDEEGSKGLHLKYFNEHSLWGNVSNKDENHKVNSCIAHRGEKRLEK